MTGGWFTDPVTGITYTAVLDGTKLSFADSGNAASPTRPLERTAARSRPGSS